MCSEACGFKFFLEAGVVKKFILILLLAVIPSSTGCMTITTQIWYFNGRQSNYPQFNNNMLYTGVRNDILWLSDGGKVSRMAPMIYLIPIFDLPFSLVLDTVLLPLTVTQTILFSDGNAEE